MKKHISIDTIKLIVNNFHISRDLAKVFYKSSKEKGFNVGFDFDEIQTNPRLKSQLSQNSLNLPYVYNDDIVKIPYVSNPTAYFLGVNLPSLLKHHEITGNIAGFKSIGLSHIRISLYYSLHDQSPKLKIETELTRLKNQNFLNVNYIEHQDDFHLALSNLQNYLAMLGIDANLLDANISRLDFCEDFESPLSISELKSMINNRFHENTTDYFNGILIKLSKSKSPQKIQKFCLYNKTSKMKSDLATLKKMRSENMALPLKLQISELEDFIKNYPETYFRTERRYENKRAIREGLGIEKVSDLIHKGYSDVIQLATSQIDKLINIESRHKILLESEQEIEMKELIKELALLSINAIWGNLDEFSIACKNREISLLGSKIQLSQSLNTINKAISMLRSHQAESLCQVKGLKLDPLEIMKQISNQNADPFHYEMNNDDLNDEALNNEDLNYDDDLDDDDELNVEDEFKDYLNELKLETEIEKETETETKLEKETETETETKQENFSLLTLDNRRFENSHQKLDKIFSCKASQEKLETLKKPIKDLWHLKEKTYEEFFDGYLAEASNHYEMDIDPLDVFTQYQADRWGLKYHMTEALNLMKTKAKKFIKAVIEYEDKIEPKLEPKLNPDFCITLFYKENPTLLELATLFKCKQELENIIVLELILREGGKNDKAQ